MVKLMCIVLGVLCCWPLWGAVEELSSAAQEHAKVLQVAFEKGNRWEAVIRCNFSS